MGKRRSSVGQPVVDAALEALAGEILNSVVGNSFCCVQEWDERLDCCMKLENGTIVGEMLRLSDVTAEALQAIGERLKRRSVDEKAELKNEIFPPILIRPD